MIEHNGYIIIALTNKHYYEYLYCVKQPFIIKRISSHFCFAAVVFVALMYIGLGTTKAQSFNYNNQKCDSLYIIEEFAQANPYCLAAFEQVKMDPSIPDSIGKHITILSAFSQFQSGEFNEAAQAFEKIAYDTYNKTGLNDTFVWANEQLVDVYTYLGDNKNKIRVTNILIDAITQLYGETDINLWYYYYMAAETYILTGDYAPSIQYFNKAADLYLLTGRPKDGNYARILVENSSNMLIVGKYQESINNNLEALSILDTLSETYYDIVADAYQLMTWCYKNIGDYESSFDYINKLISIAGELEPLIRANNLVSATLFIINLDIQEGTSYAKESKLTNILHDALGIYDSLQPDAIFVNNVYTAFGNYYSNEGVYDSVIYYYNKSLKLIEQAYGKKNIIYMNGFTSLAATYEAVGDLNNAEIILDSLIALSESFLASNFIFLSESEKESILSSFMLYRNSTYAFYDKYTHTIKNKAEVFYNTELFMKGLLLQNITSLRNNIMRTGNPQIISEFNNWISLKQTLAAMYINKDPGTAAIEHKAEQLEKSLTNKNVVVNNANENWKPIAQQLKTDEVAIEFVYFPTINDDSYYALVLTPQAKEPVAIKLFSGSELLKLLAYKQYESSTSYINRLYTYPNPEFPEDTGYYLGGKLYQQIWAPLEPYLKGARKIYLSPTGLLHQIAFNAIPIDASTVLMEKYAINMVSNTADLLRPSSAPAPQSFLLVGDIDYGDNDNLRGRLWKQLPGTMVEISGIKTLLEKQHKNVLVVAETAASENFIKQIGPSDFNVLHLATHGYFYNAQREGDTLALMNKFENSVNPMLRSGLLFADANKYWTQVNTSGNDGALTAFEISNMNLFDVSLVVLSACETGLGDIRGSEGVYGLQRAFKMAGVDQLVISLWRVPDAYTAELMTQFYAQLVKGKTADEALQKAQLYMKHKTGIYNWGAFVLIN